MDKIGVVVLMVVKGKISIEKAASILCMPREWLLDEMVSRGFKREAILIAKGINPSRRHGKR
jgi:predicted HTH domain antitoxin